MCVKFTYMHTIRTVYFTIPHHTTTYNLPTFLTETCAAALHTVACQAASNGDVVC